MRCDEETWSARPSHLFPPLRTTEEVFSMDRSLRELGSRTGGALQRLSSFFSGGRSVPRSKTPPPQREKRGAFQIDYYLPEAVVSAPGEQTQRRRSTSKRNAASEGPAGESPSYGLPRNLQEHYDLGRILGQGGNACVVRAVSRRTGKEFACKCLPKVRLFYLRRVLHVQRVRSALIVSVPLPAGAGGPCGLRPQEGGPQAGAAARAGRGAQAERRAERGRLPGRLRGRCECLHHHRALPRRRAVAPHRGQALLGAHGVCVLLSVGLLYLLHTVHACMCWAGFTC